ncbi:MAG TPA: hypothetical protein DCP92_22420 [Nitrospiraceae bacterium]|nr:hypothetical protein [Nitrospiraceae bacterium]
MKNIREETVTARSGVLIDGGFFYGKLHLCTFAGFLPSPLETSSSKGRCRRRILPLPATDSAFVGKNV